MTLLTSTDSKLLCRMQLTGEDRWVSLTLSLNELAPAARFLVISERLSYEMAGSEEAAQKYGLANWQGGIVSGARYAFRALKTPLQQVCLHELRGQLGVGDIWAISSAAAAAVARLLSRLQELPLEFGGWRLEEEVWRPRPRSTETVPQSTESAPSELRQRQEPVTSLPPTPANTENKGDMQQSRPEQSASADRPRE